MTEIFMRAAVSRNDHQFGPRNGNEMRFENFIKRPV